MDRMKSKAKARFAFSEFLGSCGKRCTPERLLVLDVVMEQRAPFTAEGLYELCAEHEGISICRATLFNTLPLLVGAGFIRRYDIGGHVTYETVRTSSTAKGRLLMACTRCGRTYRRTLPEMARWVESLPLRGFTPDASASVLQLPGLCAKCRSKAAAINLQHSSHNNK